MSANFTHHYLFRNKFMNSVVAGFWLSHPPTKLWNSLFKTLTHTIQIHHFGTYQQARPSLAHNSPHPDTACVTPNSPDKAEHIHKTFNKNALKKHAFLHAAYRWVWLPHVCDCHPFSLQVQRRSALQASFTCTSPSCEACLDHHSWKWSWPCLWTHVGYVIHSTQMAFYIYCLAYLVIFSYVYVCFQQADNRIFENREITILCSFPQHLAFVGWWEAGKGRTWETWEAAELYLQHRRPREQTHPLPLPWGLKSKSLVKVVWWVCIYKHQGHGLENSCLRVTGQVS